MNTKTILKFNSTKSIRPASWLALAILALGAFGNSVQAQAWLNENFSAYTGTALSGGTYTSPNLITANGSPTSYTTVVNDGGNVARYNKSTTSGGSQVMFGLSPYTGSGSTSTARTSGYISFKIKQNINAGVGNTLSFDVGIGSTTTATVTSASEARLIGLSFKQTGTATGSVQVTRADGSAATTSANTVITSPYSNSTSFSTVEVWFNDSDSAGMPYKDPSGNSQTLPINSFAVYVNKTFITSATFWGAFATTGSLNIGKIGFSTSSTKAIDFSFDDLYAAASAPLAILSPSTATTSVGSTFNYTISTTAVSGVTFSSSTLPGGLTLTPAGVITGQPTTPGTYTINLTARASGQTDATATLTIEVTAVPTIYTWNNQGTAWSSGTSWTNGTAPATSALIDTAQFGSLNGPATDVNVGSGNTIKGIVFEAGAYAYTWTGTDIKVLSSGAITNNSSVTQTFANKMINSGNATWSSGASGSSMLFNGGIDLSDSSVNSTLTFAGAGNVTVGGAIANGGTSTGGAVTFTSTGTNLLSGNNTYGGATTISSGATLQIGSATALGSTTGSTVVSSGGVLDLSGQTVSGETLSLEGSGISANGALVNTSINNASWSGPVALVSSATFMNASSGNIRVSGVVSGVTRGITKIGAGTLELSGANTYTGTTTVANGTMILSGPNTSATYAVLAITDGISPVLKVSGSSMLNSSATLTGSSAVVRTGTLDFATAGDFTLNQYNVGNMNFTASSGSPTTLTFTSANNALSSGGGRTLANQSPNLTVTFNGQLDISGTSTDSSAISGIGPVVILGRVYSTGTTFTRSLVKKDTGNLTMSGVNSYNGTTTVSGGTLRIPAGGSLVGCGDTIVKGIVSTATLASLNLGGAAGVVQVSTNGFVRGDTNGSTTTRGTISSLQVQNLGTVEVALGNSNTWITGGTIDFAPGSKVLVTGTVPAPATGSGPYTLMTASDTITGTIPTLSPAIPGWNLDFSGANLILEETPPNQFEISQGEQIFSEIISGGIPLDKRGDGTAIITGSNTFSGGTVLGAGILEVRNSNGLGTGAVTLTSGTLRSTVDLDLGKLVESTTAISAGFQAVYGGASSRLRYTTGQPTTINGPVTLEVGDGYTMTMGTLIGNSSPSSLVTKIGAGTVKLMGESTKLADAGMALDGNASSVLGGWRIQEGTVWFTPSANNGGGNGPIILAGGTAKFSKLQNSNGTYTAFVVPSDLTVESSGLIQFDPNSVTLLGQNNLEFKNLSIGTNTLEVATGTTSTVVGQDLPSVNFKSATLTGSAILKNPVNLDLNLQAVSGVGGFTKTGLGTLYLSDQPNRAAAFAALTGTAVASINVEYAGSGYLVAPIVTVVPVNGGSGALATATIDNNGRVTSIAVTTAGSGYLSLPRIQIAAPPTLATENSYTGATIVDQGKLNLSGSYASSVTVKLGAALQLDWLAPAQAKCSIDGISPTSASPNAANSYVKNLYLTKSVGGYQPGTFEFDLPAPAKVDGSGTATGTATYVLAAARAKATVDLNGFISALEILNGGSGYAITPMVTIPAPTVPRVVATTTGSITFEAGAQLSVNNPPIGTGASCTLLTADGGINGNPDLVNLPGYTLTKSGNSLILTDNREGPTFSDNPTAAAITYGQSLAPSNLNSAGLTSVPGSFAWKNAGTSLPAGTSSQIVIFTPNDLTAYRPAEFTVSVTVSKANPTVTWPTTGAITYGDALSAAVFSGASTNGNFAFTSPATVPNAGIAQNFEVIFTPADAANYNTLRQNVAVTVNKANPTVTWPTAGAITAGQALSLSTLSGGSATGVGGAIVEGAFAWTDSTTARSTTGSYEVTFTPTSGNYNTATQAVSVTVNPAGTIYNDWLTANGGTASDAAFLDYVFGAATAGALPASLKPTVAVTGANLVLTYYVRQGTLGLTVTAQTSADLAAGAAGWGTSGVNDVPVGEPTTAANGVSVQQRTASVSVSGGNKFLRIQAVQAAP